MRVELINTGSELMLGRVLNTHQQWICRRLADEGYVVSQQVAVPDTGPAIESAIRESLGRADFVITTGGLGPTSDDITRDLVAQLLGVKLREDSVVLGHIKSFFDVRKRTMPERTKIQALVPEGATVLANPYGTAPGMAMELKPNPFRAKKRSAAGSASWLIMLPGPPRELRPMFNEQVLPLLRRVLPLSDAFVCSTLRSTGIGESMVEEQIAEPLRHLTEQGLEIGYCARPGQVDVRLVARGAQAKDLVEEAEKIVTGKIGTNIFGSQDEALEEVLVRILTEQKRTLALAESCTGGCIAHRITNVPGASNVLLAGIVSYSNAAKQKFLGVRGQTLAEHGAVSKAVAREMAEGARREAGADFGLSVTGIAGPSGGSADKPVGTVFIGLAGPFETVVVRNFNPYERETFKQVTANQALELVRRYA